ncbi:MAG: hypothetical protein GX410_07460 [Elusimicrobia bacterium]|nr:hypothetical protein [Elusimicrobiota bacterium]
MDTRKPNTKEDTGGYLFFSGIMTMSASYRITPRVALRANWNRTITNYNRDTDVMTGGLAYRF